MEILNENEGQFWYDGIVIWIKVKLVGRKDLQQYDFQFHALTWKTKRLILKILFLWLLLLNLFTFGWRWSDANFPEANLKSFRRDSTSVGFTRWVNAHCTFANRRWKRSWFCFAIYLWFYFLQFTSNIIKNLIIYSFSFQHGAADVGLSRWAECTFANRGDPNSPKI